MKKSIVMIFAALCCSVAVSFAQNPTPRPEGRGVGRAIPTTKEGIDSAVVVRVGDLRGRLALTDEQALSMIKLLRASYTERAKNAKDFRDMTPEQRTAMREANQKTEKDLVALMTDQQKKKYDEYLSSMRQGQGRSGGAPSGGRRGGQGGRAEDSK